MLYNPEQPASIIPFEQDQSNSIRCVKFENSPMKTNTIIKQQPHPSLNLITATASAYTMRLEIRGNTQLRIRNSKKKEDVKSSITWRNFASTIFIQRFGNTISGGGGINSGAADVSGARNMVGKARSENEQLEEKLKVMSGKVGVKVIKVYLGVLLLRFFFRVFSCRTN